MKNCEYCGKEFLAKSARAKFCSEACKQKNKRDSPKKPVETKGVSEKEPEEDSPDNSPKEWWEEHYDEKPLPGIDTQFAKDRIKKKLPAASFTDTLIKNCEMCRGRYKTQLSLMRYCSLNCKNEAFGRGA